MKPIHSLLILILLALTTAAVAETPNNGSVLPFPPTPMSESVAKPRLQDSKMKWPEQPARLPDDAPNILIVLIDDVGFGVADTFGGEVHTPTLSKLADEGMRYNAFHTTAICSPTRAVAADRAQPHPRRLRHDRRACGRLRRLHRHHPQGGRHRRRGAQAIRLPHLGLRQMAQHARHRDHGHRPQGPLAERLRLRILLRLPRRRNLAVGTAAGRKLRHRRAARTTIRSIISPRTWRTRRSTWIDKHQSFAPDKPFLMYWAPGAVHGPHHIFPEWADKYKGKFDDGWDAYRERVFKRQLEMGIIPPGTKLTPRDETMAAWDRHPRGPARLPDAA